MNKAFALLSALLLLASCSSESPFLPDYPSIDLVIENGEIVDGLGGEPYRGDVVIVGEDIVFVGESAFTAEDYASRVERRVDAEGRVIAPGFIDLHSHGDPLTTPEMENFLAMGVTTITLGQDGSSPATVSIADWMSQVADAGIGTNLAMFVGHGSLRTASGIGRKPVPDPEELERMLSLLDQALDVTFGMTTGLEYTPGLYAERAELEALARVVGEHDRMIMSHMRNEDDHALEASIEELLNQGQYARVHISHLKSVYGRGAERAQEILDIIVRAREADIDVTAEMYPYSASYTGIAILFPEWAKTDEQFVVARAERRDELAEYLRNRVNLRNGPEATLLGTDPWTGRTLADVAHEMEMPFEDVLIDVIGPTGASGAYFVMNEELQSSLLAHPLVGVCSDGSPTGFHPRGHGTFARIIERYVMEQGLLTLPEAVEKMTSFAAGVLRIEDRGSLQAGMKADVIVFDPARVHENASYPDPLRLAEGFDLVIVNGQVARERSQLAPAVYGQVLTP